MGSPTRYNNRPSNIGGVIAGRTSTAPPVISGRTLRRALIAEQKREDRRASRKGKKGGE